jgi:hypothetical protein
LQIRKGIKLHTKSKVRNTVTLKNQFPGSAAFAQTNGCAVNLFLCSVTSKTFVSSQISWWGREDLKVPQHLQLFATFLNEYTNLHLNIK